MECKEDVKGYFTEFCRLRKTWICLLLLVLCSCGIQGPGPGPQGISSSNPKLTAPPVIGNHGSFSDAWNWTLADDSAVVTLHNTTDPDPAPTLTLPAGEVQVLVVTTWFRPAVGEPPYSIIGTPYLLVGSIDAQDVFTLYRFHDTDSDGQPDQSSRTVLFDSGASPLYVTDLTPAGLGPDLYLLDARCQDVLRASDTSADGWPDQIETTPFAASADYEALEHVRMVDSAGPGVVDAPLQDRYLPDGSRHSLHVLAHGKPWLHLEDGDSDGVADAADVLPLGESSLAVYGRPFDGQKELDVAGEPGDTVEVWSIDADGEPDVMLGRVVLGTGPWTPLTLTPALAEGDDIGIRSQDQPDAWLVRKVWGAYPQILSVSSAVIDDDGATVRITGENLSAGTEAVLYTKAGTATRVLTLSVTDSRHGTVTIPAVRAEESGTAKLAVKASSQSPEAGTSLANIWLCDTDP